MSDKREVQMGSAMKNCAVGGQMIQNKNIFKIKIYYVNS